MGDIPVEAPGELDMFDKLESVGFVEAIRMQGGG